MVFKEQPLLFYALTPTVLTVSRLWMLEAVCLVVRAQPRVCSAPEICKIEGMSQVTFKKYYPTMAIKAWIFQNKSSSK